jgi:thioredoxin reductase
MDNFRRHAESSGSEIIQDTVINVDKNENGFVIKTASQKEFNSKYVIYAT